MNIKRLFFDFHIWGFSLGGYIILTLSILLSYILYNRHEDKIKPFYDITSCDNIEGVKIGTLCVANVYLNNGIPWVLLAASNIWHLVPFSAHITIGCIILNITIDVLLLPYDMRKAKEIRGCLIFSDVFSRLFASLCCLHQIYIFAKILTKPKETKKRM